MLRKIPDSDGIQQLLNHMVEEDADRRAQESADYLGEHYGPSVSDPYGAAHRTTGSWGSGAWDGDSWGSGAHDTDSWHHEPH